MATSGIFQFHAVDAAGNVLSLASVEVRQETVGFPLATLFSDRAGTLTLGNPFSADVDGYAAFYVAGGIYKITAYTGSAQRIWRNVPIGTSQQLDSSIDGSFAANSDLLLPTQKAIKTYVDSSGGAGGDVDGPAGAVDNAIVAFNGATGKVIKQGVTSLPIALPLLTTHIRRKHLTTVELFIREDGLDDDWTAHDGSANLSTKAFRTLNGCFRYIERNIDLGGFSPNINVGAGDFPPCEAHFAWTGNAFINIRGQGTTTIIKPYKAGAPQLGGASHIGQTLVLVDDQCALGIEKVRLSAKGFDDGTSTHVPGTIGLSAHESATMDFGDPTGLSYLYFEAMHVGVSSSQLAQMNGIGPIQLEGDLTGAMFEVSQNSRLGVYSGNPEVGGVGTVDINIVGAPVIPIFLIIKTGGNLNTNGLPVNIAGAPAAGCVPYFVYQGTRDDSGTVWPGTGLVQDYGFPCATRTLAQLPTANGFGGATVLVSDAAGGNPILYFSDGSNWRPLLKAPGPVTNQNLAKWADASGMNLGEVAPGVISFEGRTGAVVGAVGDYRLAELYDTQIQPQGRLTLSSGSPVMTADVSGATFIFYSPYCGQIVPYFDGTRWLVMYTGELALQLSAADHLTGNLYDLFVDYNAGAPRLVSGPAWTNLTTRAGAVVRQEGIRVNAAAMTVRFGIGGGDTVSIPTGRLTYVGTFLPHPSAGQASFTFGGNALPPVPANLLLWNMYNRRRVVAALHPNEVSHTYPDLTVRAFGAYSGYRINVVTGFDEDGCNILHTCAVGTFTGTTGALLGLAKDSTTLLQHTPGGHQVFSGIVNNFVQVTSTYEGLPGLGFHFWQGTQRGDNNGANPANFQSESGARALLRGTFLM